MRCQRTRLCRPGRHSIKGNHTKCGILTSAGARDKNEPAAEVPKQHRSGVKFFRRTAFSPPHGFVWDELSDTGGYAHLISAACQWLLYLEGKNDWAVHQVPGIER